MLEYTVTCERPWVFGLLFIAAFFVFFPYFRTPRNKRRTIGRLISLVARSVSILLVTIMLSGFTITLENYEYEETDLVIVVDYSDSTEELQEQMNDFVQDLIMSADEKTRIATIIFADKAVVANDFDFDHNAASKAFFSVPYKELTKDATNIQTALFEAAAMFDSLDNPVNKRVVLLSDGRQTSGNAWEAANVFLNKGIRLDAVSFDITGNKMSEVAIKDFAISPSHIVDQGKNFTIMVSVESTVDTEGSIIVYNGENKLFSFTTSINKGTHIFNRTISAEELGSVGLHELRVEVNPIDDSLAPNNALHTWVKVNDIPSILIVDGTGSQSSKLQQQLEGVYHTNVIRAEKFPQTMEELLPYDEIVLMDVNTERLPVYADVLIDRFVKDLGRGLLTTTGPTLDSYASYTGTLLEDMLPVTMTLDENHNNIAMVIVLDDSGSMVDGTDKFSPALEGIKICIDALAPNDYVGIVTFHAESKVQQEMIKVEGNKETLKAQVAALSTNRGVGGTSYSEGLKEAYSMLLNFDDARSKHVIFLSDGAPTDSNYGTFPATMKKHGMTLSTISLLANAQAKSIMSKLATDGDGYYYDIATEADLETLTGIMEDLTLKAKEPKFVNTEPFIPKATGEETGVLSGIEDLTQIIMGGYIGSTIKDEGIASLYNDDYRPIIAERAWGKGKVTSLMTDLGGEWGAELYDNEIGLLLIGNLVAQSLNEEVLATSMTITANQQDREAQIRVETGLQLPGQTLEVSVKTLETVGNKQELVDLEDEVFVNQIGLSVFRVSFHTEDPNRVYFLEMKIRDELGNVQDYATIAYAGGMIKEYDLFSDNGVALLNSVAEVTYGKLFTTVEEIYDVDMPDANPEALTGLIPFSIALIVFMLLDIFMRIMNFTRKPKVKHQ